MELDQVRHRTNIKAVVLWVILLCMLSVMASIAALIVAHAAKLTSHQLIGVDWGNMFSLGIFLIMLGVAVAIPIGSYRRSPGP